MDKYREHNHYSGELNQFIGVWQCSLLKGVFEIENRPDTTDSIEGQSEFLK
jgi:hypothetical protein